MVAGDGGRTVELNRLGAGEFFGELMLSGELRAATVEVTVRARLTSTVRRLVLVDVYGRLVGLFDALAVDDAGRRMVPGPLSQALIAERLGASKSLVCTTRSAIAQS